MRFKFRQSLFLPLVAASMAVTLNASGADGDPAQAGSYSVSPRIPAATEREQAAEPEGSQSRVLTPGGSSTSATSSGPGVELITGGSSTDGAARVGRLPILD